MMPPELLAGLRGPRDEPDPEQVEAIRALYRKEAELEIAWRKTTTGPWAFLFCTCKRSHMFTWRPGNRPVTARCMVHGQFLISPDGSQIL